MQQYAHTIIQYGTEKVAPGLVWLTGLRNIPPATNSETVFSLKLKMKYSIHHTVRLLHPVMSPHCYSSCFHGPSHCGSRKRIEEG